MKSTIVVFSVEDPEDQNGVSYICQVLGAESRSIQVAGNLQTLKGYRKVILINAYLTPYPVGELLKSGIEVLVFDTRPDVIREWRTFPVHPLFKRVLDENRDCETIVREYFLRSDLCDVLTRGGE